MKNIIAIIAMGLIMISCNTEASEKQKTENPPAQMEVLAANEPVSTSIHLTKDDFLDKVMNYEKNTEEWVYEGDLPCIVDFYADWCGPCKIASPVLDELAEEYAGKIYIYKVNTDVERELSGVFGIRSIPTFLLVPQEGKPSMSSGIGRTPEETKEMFRKMINEVLLVENDA